MVKKSVPETLRELFPGVSETRLLEVYQRYANDNMVDPLSDTIDYFLKNPSGGEPVLHALAKQAPIPVVDLWYDIFIIHSFHEKNRNSNTAVIRAHLHIFSPLLTQLQGEN